MESSVSDYAAIAMIMGFVMFLAGGAILAFTNAPSWTVGLVGCLCGAVMLNAFVVLRRTGD